MVGRKSLLDDLADLISPMPKDLDPEAQELGTGAILPEHDQQLEVLASDLGRSRDAGRLQMRAGIELQDAAYRGRKTSRSSMFPDGEEGLSAGHAAGMANGKPGKGRAAGAAGAAGGKLGNGLAGSGRSGGKRARVEEEGEEEEGEGEGGSKGSEDGEDGLSSEDLDGLESGSGLDEGEGEEGEEGDEDEEGEGMDEGEEDEGEMEEGEEGDEGDSGDGVGGGSEDGVGDGQLRELEAGYKRLQEEEQKAVGSLRERGRRDVAKGRAARQQQMLYERMLEMRILLQKALGGSNRLPLPSTTAHVTELAHMTAPPGQQQQPPSSPALAAAQNLQQRLDGLREAAAGALSQLMELHDTIISCPQSLSHGLIEVPSRATAPPAASAPAATHWDALSARALALAPFRDASLDRWHARAVLTSGSATLRGGGLKALNQSVSKQVAVMMQDPHKLIQRCRLMKGTGATRRLGEPSDPSDHHPDNSDDDMEAYPSLGGAGAQRDEETYDDGEFYQQLLKEFLEQSGAAGGGDGLGARAAKKRKVVDRRASKGRKIRFNVQDKLVNFMSAAHMEAPVFADQLFANLFASAAGR